MALSCSKAVLRGITLKNNGDFYCLNCPHFFKTTRALSRANYFWKSGGGPKLEAPEQGHAKHFHNHGITGEEKNPKIGGYKNC